MMKNILLTLIGFVLAMPVMSQGNSSDSSLLVSINQQIDDAVVAKDVSKLEGLYANDFVFSHGSGNIQDKKAWLLTVARTTYPIRRHDSVKVELHPGIAIVKGKMSIERVDKTKTAKYHLRYIRVYALRRDQWQLISHSTTHETHEQ